MTSHSVSQLLVSLGITKSHSRPHVSNDNPFSESQFKTMKYRPDFPERFGCYEDGLGFCRQFFTWHNHEHYHSGIGLVTPASLHYGQASKIVESRTRALQLAYAAHPERFVSGVPKPPELPSAVWINPPVLAEQERKRLPEIHCPQKPDEAPLTHPRSDYPSASCVPAELASVSSDSSTIPCSLSSNTRVMPEKIPGGWGWPPRNSMHSTTPNERYTNF
jgi:hypothetical protein